MCVINKTHSVIADSSIRVFKVVSTSEFCIRGSRNCLNIFHDSNLRKIPCTTSFDSIDPHFDEFGFTCFLNRYLADALCRVTPWKLEKVIRPYTIPSGSYYRLGFTGTNTMLPNIPVVQASRLIEA